MNSRTVNIIFLAYLSLCSFASGVKVLQSTTQSLTENQAKELVQKYQPAVYLHKSEKYFPVRIDDLDINWEKAKLNEKNTFVSYTYKTPNKFDSKVPIYTSVFEDNSTNTVRISYVFYFGFNGCGPKAKIKAKMTGLGIDEFINLCPADLHWGDVEHIEVTLSRKSSTSSYSTISSIKYAFHQWSHTYTSDGSKDGYIKNNVSFEGGSHPVVFLANGSHASYPSSGDQYYYTVFSEKKSPWYDTYLKFVDFCAPSKTEAFKWYGSAKLLKLNGVAVSGISSKEYYGAFLYYGKMGDQIKNSTASDLVAVLNKIRGVAKKLKLSKVTKAIDSAKDNLNGFFQATGCTSLGSPSRTWW